MATGGPSTRCRCSSQPRERVVKRSGRVVVLVLLAPALALTLAVAGTGTTAYLPLVTSRASSVVPPEIQALERAVADLINEERNAHGLPPLSEDDRLVDAARGHSQDMAENGFLSHTGSDGSDIVARLNAVGYDWSACGEVLGAGYASPDEVVEAWMSSPGHRSILLDDAYLELGVGYAANETGPYDRHWTVDVARPALP